MVELRYGALIGKRANCSGRNPHHYQISRLGPVDWRRQHPERLAVCLPAFTNLHFDYNEDEKPAFQTCEWPYATQLTVAASPQPERVACW
ncbi:MAG: hypothetical protein H6656_08540 [Ardenticatenaceae bacterium]|nr:hypothetical protein [Ardenticatenaceae bacterium]